jgi:acyl-CoA thioester hydrolase
MSPIYKHDIKVTTDMVDGNGHANNVAYVQWLQDAAIQHARVSGCSQVSSSLGAAWVVRTHHVEYLRPTFAGDAITVLTWVSNFRKVRSRRKYKLVRNADQAVVAKAATDWVLVDAQTGRPQVIPEETKKTLPVVSKEMEP